MQKNQIKVKRIHNGTQTFFTIKNGMVYDARGKNQVYCSCTGKTVETATPMEYADGEVYCPKCHEKKVEVLQTYEEWKTEKEEKERKINEEKLANLHLVEMGSDWECGFKFYGLSATIEYEDWLKVKEHFHYYKRGWSREEELEWEYGEPTGWLTAFPKEVEEILVKEGLIKKENTIAAIHERAEQEKQKKAEELKKAKAKREAIKKEMDALDEKIREAFDSKEARTLDDAEASHFYRGDYGTGTVCRYTITENEIIKCRNMGDFTYAIAIPYDKNVENIIKEFYKLNEEFWK